MMLQSNLCDYSDAYRLVKGAGADTASRNEDERNKQAKFKNCASFAACIIEIINK